ncbi:N-6 DNA methylase [Streptomyces sp. SID13666]|uniref:type ISP restriction/modification enzyme n=1 Tax=Streptomyces sp. SID13666 TaxID=2706054 RepID=UPI0013BEF5AA|nr:type ISP restriction/modification enzyme [Streptomyces sp. SID13666]NEA55618.1 N-6 DNA methylase [Streptomyces sp. SID13666]
MSSRRRIHDSYEQAVQSAVSAFGAEVTPKLRGSGWQEDQLRGPLENLVWSVCHGLGLEVTLTGEVPLVDLRARPDYEVKVGGALVGYIELKKPGTQADPSVYTGRNAEQWRKLRLLNNVLLCDGNEFSVHQNGQRVGEVAHMRGSVLTSGDRLAPADGALARVLYDFLTWEPQTPRTTSQLIRAIAGLCQLLSEEVGEAITQEKQRRRPPTFTTLAKDWRHLLFPETSDAEFIEQYGQAVVFALLLARVEGIVFEGDTVRGIASKLGKKHSLMGQALDVLAGDSVTGLSTTLNTLLRVIGAVRWEVLDDGTGDAYFLLYEQFLHIYDPDLRIRTGSYYTPHGVVSAMARLVEDVLRRDGFRIPSGFASPDVVLVDPAMGTGTFLLSALELAARTIAEDEGPGAVGPRLREMVGRRLVGFEMQVGPFAVAELRMHAMLKKYGSAAPAAGLRLLVADALDSPTAEFNWIPHTYRALAESRRQANHVKRDERVMVVMGNPPHDAVRRGAGKWVERGDPEAGIPAPLDSFRQPGNGRYESKIANLYVYFWRWATWKVFDAHDDAPFGVVALITPKSWLKGPAFAGMRRYLRETADEGWIIDLSPQGHRADVATRIFPEVAQELCIAIFVRWRDSPRPPTVRKTAKVRHVKVFGRRHEKVERLTALTLNDPEWRYCASGPTDPFLPPGSDLWESSPSLKDLMPWSSRGVTPGRMWVYAPDEETLQDRWRRFLAADTEQRRAMLGDSGERTPEDNLPPLPGVASHGRTPLAAEHRANAKPVRIGFRSFDRQYVLPDSRLMERGRADLWRVRSDEQIYTVEQNAHPVINGPGLVFSALITDMDYYNNRSGCARPLYRNAAATLPNLAPGLLSLLTERLGVPLTPEDLLAYIAAVASHPDYSARFKEDLEVPGARIPLTADSRLWEQAVGIGRRVLWLHTYGERYADDAAGRPYGRVLLPRDRPRCVEEIPDDPEAMPEKLEYDPVTQDLWIGAGRISPVPRTVREYEVSGMNVLDKWFGYRRKEPAGKRRLELDHVVAQRWLPVWTTELLGLLNVLGLLIREEPAQAALLDDVCTSPLITVTDLTTAGILPVPPEAAKPLRAASDTGDGLFEL